MSFDAVFRLELSWLTSVWENGKVLLGNISYQLQQCELLVDPRFPPMTNADIENIETHISSHIKHPAFCTRRSLIAEYRRVWNLCRYAIGEGPPAALAYADKVLHRDPTNAAGRLGENYRFHAMIRELGSNKPHPKIEKLWELVPQLAGQQVLVLCAQKKTVDHLKIGIKDRGYSRTAVSTATLSKNVDARVNTILVYNAISTDTGYLEKFMPCPKGQRVLLTMNSPLDLGMRFYRPGIDVLKPPKWATAVLGRRIHKQKDELTPLLRF